MQNKLFILVENGSRGEDEIGSFEEVSYHIERVLTDYTSIPEFDGLIYESNSEIVQIKSSLLKISLEWLMTQICTL